MPDLIITRRRLLQCAGGFLATTAVPVTWAKLMDRVLAIETTKNVSGSFGRCCNAGEPTGEPALRRGA